MTENISGVRREKVMSEKKELGVTTQRMKEVEIGTLLLDNDKSNVIANKLLSYF